MQRTNDTPDWTTPTPNGLELSCPAEAGYSASIVAHDGGPGALLYAPARRVSFSELLGGSGLPTPLSSLPFHAHPYGVTLL
jgi:hypothetical protein